LNSKDSSGSRITCRLRDQLSNDENRGTARIPISEAD
jgi:hypothetical protein